MDDSGDVEEDVHGSDRLAIGFDRCRVRHVERLAGDVRQLGEVGQLLLVDVGGVDAGALALEGLDGGPAHTLAGGGDDADLALKAAAHGMTSPIGKGT